MKKLLMIALVCAATFSLKANVEGFFMLSMFSPGQLPVPMTHLYGGRLTFLYGECQELFGLDLGGVGRVRERMYGAQLGFGHVVGTDAAGLQLGLAEFVESELDGCQIGIYNDVAGTTRGLQLGIVNYTSSLVGCQIGLVNIASNHKCSVLPFINIRW